MRRIMLGICTIGLVGMASCREVGQRSRDVGDSNTLVAEEAGGCFAECVDLCKADCAGCKQPFCGFGRFLCQCGT